MDIEKLAEIILKEYYSRKNGGTLKLVQPLNENKEDKTLRIVNEAINNEFLRLMCEDLAGEVKDSFLDCVNQSKEELDTFVVEDVKLSTASKQLTIDVEFRFTMLGSFANFERFKTSSKTASKDLQSLGVESLNNNFIKFSVIDKGNYKYIARYIFDMTQGGMEDLGINYFEDNENITESLTQYIIKGFFGMVYNIDDLVKSYKESAKK